MNPTNEKKSNTQIYAIVTKMTDLEPGRCKEKTYSKSNVIIP